MTPGGIENEFDDRFPEKRSRIGSDDGFPNHQPSGHKAKRRKPLRVIQQPERARLCSYKEENETIDRRPVDPPPVVEMLLDSKMSNDSESGLTKFFIRASIVHPQPVDSSSPPVYALVKTPTGADASAGEVVQTPERLRTLDGGAGQLVIFAKLSVRMPGVFRLKFTLFQTGDAGLVEITHTISEPFEVFSPKLFKGMRESTALTRHLAAQGLKVKLRTDTSVGRQSEARRRGSAPSNPSSPQPPFRPHTDPPRMFHPHALHANSAQVPSPKIATPPHSAPPRTLVWRDRDPYTRLPSNPSPSSSSMVPYPPAPGPPGPPHHMSGHQYDVHPRTQYMDDGMPSGFRDTGPALNWTPSHPSDLSAFSLSGHSPTPHASTSSSSRQSSRPPYSTQASSVPSRTSSERTEPMQSFGELRIRGQDDGFSILPHFPTQPSVSNLLSDPVAPPVIQDPGGPGTGAGPSSGGITLPPLGRPDHRQAGFGAGTPAWPRPPYRDPRDPI